MADEVAAEDDALPTTGAGREAAAVRTLEVVVGLTGRTAAPGGAGPTGARVPAAGCAEDAPISLAARSLATLAASPIRDSESATALSGAAAARAAGAVAEVVGAREATGALGAVPPLPGIPNPAGDVGFPVAVGGWVAAEVKEGAEVDAADDCGGFPIGGAACADVDACDVAPEELGADAPLPAESVSTGPSGSNN